MHFELSAMAKFAIALLMTLLLPRLLERWRLPGVLGFIAAGVILGPAGIGMLKADSPAIELWAELGKLLFMFFVGFEIDLDEFNKVRRRAAAFGALTFALPFALALALGLWLGYSWLASLLIGSIIASHTLLAHQILVRLGLLERESVLVTVGGTIFTDVASMLVLATVVSIYQTGFSWSFLGIEVVELTVYSIFVIFGLSKIARKLLIRFGDSPEARLAIMLVLIAIASELARIINLEGIVGAFLVGIAVKRTLRGKFAVEQLEVIAKALFIPTFFLATGFLIDFALLGKTITSRPLLTFGLIAALFLGKYAAAFLAARLFSYTKNDAKVCFSVTIPQMAATLASAVVGFQTKNAEGKRLLDAEFVNATLLLVVVSCVVGPILTEFWGKKLVASIPAPDAAPPPAESPALTS